MNDAAESRIFKVPSELLKPNPMALEKDQLSPEEAAKLQLRSAHESEWGELEEELENLEVSNAEKNRMEKEEKVRDLQKRIAQFEDQYGEIFYRMFLKRLADPAFRSQSQKHQFSDVAQSLMDWQRGPRQADAIAFWEYTQKLLPELDPASLQTRMMNAYASLLKESPIGSEEASMLLRTTRELSSKDPAGTSAERVPLFPETPSSPPPIPKSTEGDSGVRPRPQSRTQRAISGVQRAIKEPPMPSGSVQ